MNWRVLRATGTLEILWKENVSNGKTKNWLDNHENLGWPPWLLNERDEISDPYVSPNLKFVS